MDVQRTIEYNTERRGSGVYGPPPGKSLIVFIDDLNMPVVDEYGTQQPIALLKLLLERGGVYDRGAVRSLVKIFINIFFRNFPGRASALYNLLQQWVCQVVVETKLILAC